MTATDIRLERYARQIRLPQVGEAGQRRLLGSRVLIVGLGGLGSPVAMYLAAAGVGHLVLSDFDRVDLSNLQRQIAHRTGDLGELKARSARRTLLEIDPQLQVEALDYILEGEELQAQVRAADVVVDCTDNFPTRFELNRVAFAVGTPLVSGAAIRWEGQVATFDPRRADSPCYQCLYRDEGVEAATCAAEGVMAPVVGVIGSIQAVEVIHRILDTGPGLCGKVLLYDALAPMWHTVRLPKDPACPVCGRGK
jgi:adenylyltransferase/sulfurtransferase